MDNADFLYNLTWNGTKPVIFISPSGTDVFTGEQIFPNDEAYIMSVTLPIQIFSPSGTVIS